MSSCAVFANIYDAPLGNYQTLDILFALEHLNLIGANRFYIAENRRFERFCEHWVEKKKDDYFPPEIYRFFNGDPYGIYFGEAYGTPEIFFTDFILCDETTITFIRNHMDIQYIIEHPKTKVYIVAKKK